MSAIISPHTIATVDTGAGVPPLASAIARIQRIADLFGTKSDRNTFYRLAMQAAGNFFVTDYIPLRFRRAYATTVLGYRIGGKHPFFDTGETEDAILTKAYATARMAQGGAGVQAIIRLMAPSKVNQYPRVLAGLRTIAPREVAAIARRFTRAAREIARGAHKHTIQRGATAGKLRLSFKPRPGTAEAAAATHAAGAAT